MLVHPKAFLAYFWEFCMKMTHSVAHTDFKFESWSDRAKVRAEGKAKVQEWRWSRKKTLVCVRGRVRVCKTMGFITGYRSRRDLFGFALYETNIGTNLPTALGNIAKGSEVGAGALLPHPPTYGNRCFLKHTHAQPGVSHLSARRFIFSQLSLRKHTCFKRNNPSGIIVRFRPLSLSFGPNTKQSRLCCGWTWGNRVFSFLFFARASLLQFSWRTRCCSVFCVHRGSCGFWHSENNNHSSSAPANIRCQKQWRRRFSSHRKWVDDSKRVLLHRRRRKKIQITITFSVNTNILLLLLFHRDNRTRNQPYASCQKLGGYEQLAGCGSICVMGWRCKV